MEDFKDMFAYYDELPIEIQMILDKYAEMDFTYENCGNLIDELEVLGWTCEYGLDAEPYDLRQLTNFDKWDDETIDSVFETILNDIKIYTWLENKDVADIRSNVRTRNEKIIYFISCEEKFRKVCRLNKL
jgi:hypothetical protein